jgi:ABC-type glycerol-3-phosphate transport system substrate-binding protein
MRYLIRILYALLGLSLLVSLVALPGRTAAAPARQADNTLTIWTCCGMWAGFTKANIAGAGIPYVGYYKDLWNKRFPGLKINEIDLQNYSDMDTKTILAVNAGNAPDLIGTQGDLGLLVARKAVQNLDPFFKQDNLTASMFLPAMADWARIQGHWYAIPATSNPSAGEILYIPAFVKSAGWDPAKIPATWDELWTATQQVTKWDSKGNLMRIGVRVSGDNSDAINLYCGSFAIYDTKTGKFHANSPCIKDYFRYEKRLVDYYGGVTKYTKFISGDAGIWGGYTTKAYVPTGRIVFSMPDAYWSGQQIDNYWNVDWRLAPPPTPHGLLSERKGIRTTAWMVEVPTGAKHTQLAFDFAKYTFVDYGYVQGPTTNGYTVIAQADKWAQVVINTAGQIRASHHFPGNPMAAAAKLVMLDAALGQAYLPTDVAANYYNQQLTRAWQQIEYGQASVDQALDTMQRLVDNQQKVLHAQFGM